MTGHDDLPVAARARRLEERLIAAGLTSDDEIDEFLTRLYTKASPGNGARMDSGSATNAAVPLPGALRSSTVIRCRCASRATTSRPMVPASSAVSRVARDSLVLSCATWSAGCRV